MHGGAPGSGAPRGNKNALKNGLYTREAIAERRHIQDLVQQSRKLIQQIVYRTRFFGHKFELSGLLHSGFLPGDTCVVRTA